MNDQLASSPRFDEARAELRRAPASWLVTGAAGFIGSNLCEALLRLGQSVVGFDNFSNGFRHNVEDVRASVGPEAATRFRFIEGDLRSVEDCRRAVQGARFVLQLGALGSVPRSLAHPLDSHASNVTGILNLFDAARAEKPDRIVFASSSSVYGDDLTMPKREERTGQPLSPYAATKAMGESYAAVYARCFGLPVVGLRYFNVFGPRQRPDGPYAAVIPKWIGLLLKGRPIEIFGDGETRRDFSFVENVVQANLLAATSCDPSYHGRALNVACGQSTSLNRLREAIETGLAKRVSGFRAPAPVFRDFRPGDIRDSLADVSLANAAFGYQPAVACEQGIEAALDWYVADFGRREAEEGARA